MSLFQKLFSRPPGNESVLETESEYSRELYREKPEQWHLIIYGEFLRTRRDASLVSHDAVSSLEFLERISDPSTKMKAIGGHFGRVTLSSVEVWLGGLDRILNQGETIDLHKYQKSANEYGRIVREVAYFERIVSKIKPTDRRIGKIKDLLDGAFYASIQPILSFPDKLLQIRHQGIQPGMFYFDFVPVENLTKAKKLMKNG
jgi:hypothetical protein